MRFSTISPVLMPFEGFAMLPQACIELHRELGCKVKTFSCGASAAVKSALNDLVREGVVDLLDGTSTELLTAVEMRNRAAEQVTTPFILYLDARVNVTAEGVAALLYSMSSEDLDFASPLLHRHNRVMFAGYQLRSTHRSNGELNRLKLFDSHVDIALPELDDLNLRATDSIHDLCFMAKVDVLRQKFKGWDERMQGLELFDFALRVRYHKLRVAIVPKVQFEVAPVSSTFDTSDRAYRAFCSAESFRKLAQDAFEFKWSATAPTASNSPRLRKRDIFLRRALQHRIDNALTRIARYQSPEPRSVWRDLLLQ